MVDNELISIPSIVEHSIIEIFKKPISCYKLPDSYWNASRIVERAAPVEKRTVISTLYHLSENYIGAVRLYWNMLDIDNLLPLITNSIKKYYYEYEDEVMRTNTADGIVTEWYANLLINVYPKVLEAIDLIKTLSY